MKITQQKAFQPITITIETERDLAELYMMANDDNSKRTVPVEIFDFLRDVGEMDSHIAREILAKCLDK